MPLPLRPDTSTMTVSRSLHLPAGSDVLFIPFLVNVKDMSKDEVDGLLDYLEQGLGAKYFREKSLLWEVLDDQIAAAQDPRAFLYGPYVKVAIAGNGDLRLTSANAPVGGDTVYSLDQVQELIATLVGTPDDEPWPRER